MDNKAKFDNKNPDFTTFIQNYINGHIEWEQQQKNKKPCKINSYRRLKTVTGIKMGTFIKKNKLNNSSKWFTFGQKIRP